MNAVEQMDMGKDDAKLDTFDYSKVPVKRNSFWVVQLMHMGFVDSQQRVHETYVPGTQPIFQLIICECFFLVSLVPGSYQCVAAQFQFSG